MTKSRRSEERRVEHQLEEELFLLPPSADLAQSEEAAVGVGDERVLDAPLREEVVLHADGEEVLEGAAAEAHDVGEGDGRLSVIGYRLSDSPLFEGVEDGGRVELHAHPVGAAEELGHGVDLRGGGEIGFGLQPEAAYELLEVVAPLGAAHGSLGLAGEPLDLGHEGDVVVDLEGALLDAAQVVAGAAGDARRAGGGVGAVGVDARAGPEAVAHELQHLGARVAALAQAEEGGDAPAEALGGERQLLGERGGEAVLRGEAGQEARVVGIDGAGDDADGGGRDAARQQLGDLPADLGDLDVACLQLRDAQVRLLDTRRRGAQCGQRSGQRIGEVAHQRLREAVRLAGADRNVDGGQEPGAAQGVGEGELRAGHVVEAGQDE